VGRESDPTFDGEGGGHRDVVKMEEEEEEEQSVKKAGEGDEAKAESWPEPEPRRAAILRIFSSPSR